MNQKKIARELKHKTIYLENQIEKTHSDRFNSTFRECAPYITAFVIWLGVMFYHSLSLLPQPEWLFVPSIITVNLFVVIRFVGAIYAKSGGGSFGLGLYNVIVCTISCLLLPYHLSLVIAVIIGLVETTLLFLLSIITTGNVKSHYSKENSPVTQ